MSKITDLVAAVTELSTAELKELRLEIQRLEKRRLGHHWNLKGFAIDLARLDDDEYIDLRSRSIAIAIDNIIHPPLETEFDRNEINFFIAFFYGYLKGRLETLMSSGVQPKPFLHRIQSNHILYGYCDGEFFEDEYESEEEFDQAYGLLKAKIYPGAGHDDEVDGNVQ